MQLRDAVLEGANPSEIAALSRLCEEPDYSLPPELASRLGAKGWIDTAGDAILVTIAGRTLVERRR
mgnify:CR=1 FL=1